MVVKKTKIVNYNIDLHLKQAFLEYLEAKGYSLSQYNASCSFLKKIDKYESITGVPCYKYSENGILDMLAFFNASSIASLKSILSTLRAYIVFVGEKNGNINPAALSIDTKELESLVNPMAKKDKFITYKEYCNILKIQNVNYQDLLQIVFLWNGIMGKNYADMIEFKKEDFDGRNLIYKGKNIELSELEIDIIQKSIEEETYCYYTKFNVGGNRREVKLCKYSDYLFKPSQHYNSGETISSDAIKGRLVAFTNEILKMPALTGKGILQSRIMYDVLKQNNFNRLTTPELDSIINNCEDKKVIAYTSLATMQDILLDKIKAEG